MNRLFLLTLLASTLHVVSAQSVDYNKIIPPPEATDVTFPERLVQLAWQNYAVNRAFDLDVESAEAAIRLTKLGWWELVTLQLNINSRTISSIGQFEAPEGDNQFFPWYNVGVSLSPSKFFTIPAKIKIAEFDYEKSGQALNAQKLRLRAETLTRYEIYKHNLETVKMVSENFEIANSTFILIREKFNKGEATLTDFNAANSARIGSLTGKLGAEMQFSLAKISLEELLGMKLEEVVR
ncbi:MAG: hypothetical protein GC205_09905 [Bacteroidetes bacterium]|nr:hypothetical protein [Bacteroidota bacterium]